MQFSRRTLIPAIVAVLAIIIIIGFIIVRKRSFAGSDPFKAIPVDASLICKINDYKELSQSLSYENIIWQELKHIPSFHNLADKIAFLDSIAEVNPIIDKIINNSITYISEHVIGGRRTEFLFIINLQQDFSSKNIINSLSDICDQNISKSERKYERLSIYTIRQNEKENGQSLYFAITNGNIILSKSIIIIENAIRQLSLPTSLLDNDDFEHVLTTTGKNKIANIYINLKEIAGLTVPFASSNFQLKLSDYKEFGSWSEFDLNMTSSKIILNGFLVSGEKKDLFIDIFNGCKPVKLTCDKILPTTVSSFISIGIGDVIKMEQNLSNYFNSIDKQTSREKKILDIENKYKFKPIELFLSIIENEITVAKVKPDNSTDKQLTYFLINCKSGNQAKREIDNVTAQIAGKKGIALSALKSKYSFDKETRFDITEFPLEDLTGLVFGNLFSLPAKTFYTQIGNYIVFGESKEALGNIINCNILNKTLFTYDIYKSFSDNIDEKSFLLFYTNLSRSSSSFNEYLDPKVIKTWQNNEPVFRKIKPFGMQLTSLSNKMYSNILLQYVEDIKAKPQTVWESLLDTACQFKPQLLINHNTQENEIFVQDLNNNIYLINKSGRILWKQNIVEKIKSKIVQLDYYKNGKLQMLFSTNNYLHLIDRNGNYVERYPVRLRSHTIAGMSIFDYDKDKNYRILVPCADNKVYAYSKEGSLITGWDFTGSDYPVDQPVNHFRADNKDYIVFGDKYRTYILDRKGQQRIAVKQEIQKSKNNNYILDEAKSRILITDTTGVIYSIYLDGRVEKTSIGTYSSNHFFDLKDINADGEKDFIILDGKTIDVFKQNKAKIFSYQFTHVIKERPVFYRFSYSDRKLGFVDTFDEKIYLLNNNGKIYKGFPLEGTTMFSIGYLDNSLGKFNLIVGGRNNFLYNYSVQ